MSKFVAFFSLVLAACGSDSVTPEVSAGHEASSSSLLINVPGFKRTHLVNDIFEYSVVVPVGTGPHDKIGLHRVVKETTSGRPVVSHRPVMLVHGDNTNFAVEFLPSMVSTVLPADQSLAIALATAGMDVWGVDRRWSLVPDNTTDFSFMRTWSFATDLNDLHVAMALARATRLLSGLEEKVFMIGHSNGAGLTYAYAQDDAHRPAHQRDLRGIVPIDVPQGFSPDDTTDTAAAAGLYAALQQQYDAGVYVDQSTTGLKGLMALGVQAPNDPSPAVPGLTNQQAALFVLSATYATFAPLSPYTPWYHYDAGTFDENGLPTGLQFTTLAAVADFAAAAPSFESLAVEKDLAAIMAGTSPYDAHLADVTVPAFYVGAAGGMGVTGLYALSQLGSSDKSSLVIRLQPVGLEVLDFGHADLVWAAEAVKLVWQPIIAWLNAH